MAKKEILIIDDDNDFIESTSTILKNSGFNVSSALNGKDGYSAAKKKKPDIIIMDVMMTNMTEGFDLARELKNNTKFKDIPIIIITAMQVVTKFDDKRSLKDWLPGDGYFEKPCNPVELVKKIRSMLK